LLHQLFSSSGFLLSARTGKLCTRHRCSRLRILKNWWEWHLMKGWLAVVLEI